MEFYEALRSNGEYAFLFNCTVDEKHLKSGLAVFATPLNAPFTLYDLNKSKVCKVKPREEMETAITGCVLADSMDQILFELEEVYI